MRHIKATIHMFHTLMAKEVESLGESLQYIAASDLHRSNAPVPRNLGILATFMAGDYEQFQQRRERIACAPSK